MGTSINKKIQNQNIFLRTIIRKFENSYHKFIIQALFKIVQLKNVLLLLILGRCELKKKVNLKKK